MQAKSTRKNMCCQLKQVLQQTNKPNIVFRIAIKSLELKRWICSIWSFSVEFPKGFLSVDQFYFFFVVISMYCFGFFNWRNSTNIVRGRERRVTCDESEWSVHAKETRINFAASWANRVENKLDPILSWVKSVGRVMKYTQE